jgi:hypothetical protein
MLEQVKVFTLVLVVLSQVDMELLELLMTSESFFFQERMKLMDLVEWSTVPLSHSIITRGMSLPRVVLLVL